MKPKKLADLPAYLNRHRKAKRRHRKPRTYLSPLVLTSDPPMVPTGTFVCERCLKAEGTLKQDQVGVFVNSATCRRCKCVALCKRESA